MSPFLFCYFIVFIKFKMTHFSGQLVKWSVLNQDFEVIWSRVKDFLCPGLSSSQNMINQLQFSQNKGMINQSDFSVTFSPWDSRGICVQYFFKQRYFTHGPQSCIEKNIILEDFIFIVSGFQVRKAHIFWWFLGMGIFNFCLPLCLIWASRVGREGLGIVGS